MSPWPVSLGSSSVGADLDDSEDDSDHLESSLHHHRASSAAPVALSWRNDRTETHSDWSICVIKMEKPGEEMGREIYHVHKNILAIGSRSSEYFRRMFQQDWKEQGDTSCTLELHPLQAAVMPNVLDYLYAASDEEGANLLEMGTSTATALYSLGDYFQIADLRRRVRQFYKNDIQLHNLKLYYTHAQVLRTQKMMEHIQHVAAGSLIQVATSTTTTTTAAAASSNHKNNHAQQQQQQQQAQLLQQQQEDLGTLVSLAQVAELDFWLPVLGHLVKAKNEAAADDDAVVFMSTVSKTLSIVLVAACAYTSSQQDVALTLEVFHKLTDRATLPTVDVHTAFPLLSVEKTLMDQEVAATSTTAPDLLSAEVVPPAVTMEPPRNYDSNHNEEEGSQASLSQLQQHFVNSLLSLNDTLVEEGNSSAGDNQQASQSASNNKNHRESCKLTSLQERCVAALTEEWSSISYDHKCVELLMRLENPYLVSRIMVGALAKAKHEIQQHESNASSSGAGKPRLSLSWPQRHTYNNNNKASSSSEPQQQATDKKFRPWLPKKGTATTNTSSSSGAAATTASSSSLPSSPATKPQRQSWRLPKRTSGAAVPAQQSEPPTAADGEKTKPNHTNNWWNRKTAG